MMKALCLFSCRNLGEEQSRVVLSNRTCCDNRTILYLCIHCVSHYSYVAFEDLLCVVQLRIEFFILFNLNEFKF